MALPAGIIFRSATVVDPDDSIDCLGGYHVQYAVKNSIVNIVIILSPRTAHDPLPEEEEWLDKLDEVAIVSDDEDKFSLQRLDRLDHIEEDIQEWIEKTCQSALLQLLMSEEVRTQADDDSLEVFLNPSVINLQLKTVDGEMTVIRHEGVPPWPKELHLGQPLGLAVKLPIEEEVPIYDVNKVIIVEKAAVPVVLVDNQKLRCKLNISKDSTLREFIIYRKLSKMNNIGLRIPAFKGYVRNGKGSAAVALLLENINVQYATLDNAIGFYMDSDNELSETDSLTKSPKPSTSDVEIPSIENPSIDRRRKWVGQLKDIVRMLHENDIVWGDVKPANVVIDTNDNAWAIDFGGGFTRPWKYPADADTMLGDLKALNLIKEYMETGKWPLLPEEAGGNNDGHHKVETAEVREQCKTYNLTVREASEEIQPYHTKRHRGSCSLNTQR